ncbi:MAG: hypothetical protein CSA35_06155 [Dethiosulfovibrio peptidovorans]|nr:MAG: hypothetical protein CSA35_06155 [Dethiosulfovibrio peptidovorans]
MTQEDDAGTMGEVMSKGVAVAIFPSVIKAGLVVGGQHGEGLLLRRDTRTGQWYGPSFYNVTGGSVGLQIGVQSTALVLAVTNEKGLKGFRGDNFTLGADVAVAAGPVGRRTSAATDINMNTPIYSYSMSKGLFAGISLDGASINHDPSANKLYWGRKISPADLLNRRAQSKKIAPLITLLNDIIAKGRKK